MRILIVTPAAKESTYGNRITANRYGKILKRLGHQVQIETIADRTFFDRQPRFDLLIALHASRSAKTVQTFHRTAPDQPIIVVLTGTDLHRDMQRGCKVNQTLDLADRVVLLEPEGRKLLDPSHARKSVVIFQSASPVTRSPPPLKRTFEVSLVGHLRPVKDPFLVTEAIRLLPTDSKIKVVHIGEAMSPGMKARAMTRSDQNRRYQWLGQRSHAETQRRIARSRLTLVTSQLEGAPSVISETIVNQTPVLATRIAASHGLLGHDYPGLFDVGDARELARLMSLAEANRAFYDLLKRSCAAVKKQFAPHRELSHWRRLLADIRR